MTEAKKSLGQHWLNDEESLEAMVESAGVGPEDTVLEIGPGLGSLTKLLVARAKFVIAVELDRDLADNLPLTIDADNLQVIQEDVLDFDLNALPPGYKVVANIPYYLTSNLLRVLSEAANPPKQMALLVQKEVAERINAKPGQMSVLAVSVQLYYEPQLGKIVPARLFVPPPKIDSQIVQLMKRPQPLFPDLEADQFFRVVKAGFSERRKKLRSSLAGGLGIGKGQADELLAKAGIDGNLRAQNLSLHNWHDLYVNL